MRFSLATFFLLLAAAVLALVRGQGFDAGFGFPGAYALALDGSLTAGIRDPRQNTGPIVFPPAPPDNGETSGVVPGASGYGFVPSNQPAKLTTNNADFQRTGGGRAKGALKRPKTKGQLNQETRGRKGKSKIRQNDALTRGGRMTDERPKDELTTKDQTAKTTDGHSDEHGHDGHD